MVDVAETVEITHVTNKTELYCHYSNQITQQDCYLSLYLKTGELCVAHDPEINSGSSSMTMDEYHRIVLSWKIPCLTMDSANQLLREAESIAQRILDGADIIWDGNNHIGRLNDDASAAEEDMARLIEEYGDAPTLAIGDISFWFTETSEEELANAGLNIDSGEEELRVAANEIVTQALDEFNTVMDADDIVAYFQSAQEVLRDEVREELEQVAESMERLKARRDELICRLAAWGDSSREIAQLADLSHTGVANIVRERD
jgi:hypothetical protein